MHSPAMIRQERPQLGVYSTILWREVRGWIFRSQMAAQVSNRTRTLFCIAASLGMNWPVRCQCSPGNQCTQWHPGHLRHPNPEYLLPSVCAWGSYHTLLSPWHPENPDRCHDKSVICVLLCHNLKKPLNRIASRHCYMVRWFVIFIFAELIYFSWNHNTVRVNTHSDNVCYMGLRESTGWLRLHLLTQGVFSVSNSAHPSFVKWFAKVKISNNEGPFLNQ